MLVKTKERGFTLIEIVLVLAIAGLIFVIVFLAVSQAQAARRDTQRKTDAGRLEAAINSWAGNHNGAVPSNQAQTDEVINNYVNDFNDPEAGPYDVTYGTSAPGAVGEMSYRNGRVCNTAGTGMTSAGPRAFAVLYFLENGGAVCVDSQ